jgi:hypothetical protein
LAGDTAENVLGELMTEADTLTFCGRRAKALKQYRERFKRIAEVLPKKPDDGRNNKDEQRPLEDECIPSRRGGSEKCLKERRGGEQFPQSLYCVHFLPPYRVYLRIPQM